MEIDGNRFDDGVAAVFTVFHLDIAVANGFLCLLFFPWSPFRRNIMAPMS